MPVKKTAPEPCAPKAPPDEQAYLAACSAAEPVLARILLAGAPELGRWAITKAQARRVARQIEQERLDAGSDRQDLARLQRLMRQAPEPIDHDLARRLLARTDEVRTWLRRRWQGQVAVWILARIVTGRDPEALLELAAGGVIPPMSVAAARHARALVPSPRKTEEQRQRAAEALAAEAVA